MDDDNTRIKGGDDIASRKIFICGSEVEDIVMDEPKAWGSFFYENRLNKKYKDFLLTLVVQTKGCPLETSAKAIFP